MIFGVLVFGFLVSVPKFLVFSFLVFWSFLEFLVFWIFGFWSFWIFGFLSLLDFLVLCFWGFVCLFRCFRFLVRGEEGRRKMRKGHKRRIEERKEGRRAEERRGEEKEEKTDERPGEEKREEERTLEVRRGHLAMFDTPGQKIFHRIFEFWFFIRTPCPLAWPPSMAP